MYLLSIESILEVGISLELVGEKREITQTYHKNILKLLEFDPSFIQY